MNRRKFLKSIGYLAGAIALPFNLLSKKKPFPPEVYYGDWKHAPSTLVWDKNKEILMAPNKRYYFAKVNNHFSIFFTKEPIINR